MVIAIIAVLIGILLPSLGRARESGRSVVCASNVRQIVTGLHTYAGDFRTIPGNYWQGPINQDWTGRNNIRYTAVPGRYKHPFETSVLRDYLSMTDKIFECPTAKRQANQFFDYTMIIRMAGARIDLDWKVSYRARPAAGVDPREYFAGIPLIIEEHETFFNRTYDDASAAGRDQFTIRHGGGGHLAFLDGSMKYFKPPVGGDDKLEEAADLKIEHLRLHVGSRFYSVAASAESEYGWVNKPR